MHRSTAVPTDLDFRSLFDAWPDPCLVFSRDFTIVAVNDAYLHATSVPREEFVGRGLTEVCDAESVTEVRGGLSLRHSLERALRRGVPDATEAPLVAPRRARQRDAEAIPCLWRSLNVPILSGGEVHWILHRLQDVSPILPPQALRESREILQAIIDGTAAAVHVKDVDGRFLFVNRRFETLLGKPACEIIGRCAGDLYPAEIAERAEARDGQILREGRPIEFEEELYLAGQRRTWCVDEFPIFDFDHTPYALCTIANDITASRQIQAQLRQAQKMEAIGQLAGGIAHDFNNLLTAILGYASLAAGGVTDRPHLCGYLQEIAQTAERGAALTRQLLPVSRNQTLQLKVVSLNSLVTGIESMLRQLLGQEIELETSLARDAGNVLADPGKIEQVIVNLVVNARDAMPAGGTLRLKTANVELDAEHTHQHPGARSGSHLLIAVADTGHGMDAATRAHIFEPYFTTKVTPPGTGLGLATVYGIVQQSGGQIEVESAPGEGTTFTIYLPRVPSVLDERPLPLAAAPEPASNGQTVLVVEDDEILRDLIAIFLGQGGYRVLAATSAVTALRWAADQSESIDLLLTDVAMPTMSGPDLVARLRTLGIRTRVLFMSGYTADVIANRGLFTPDLPLLEKPFSKDSLLRGVRDALAQPPSAASIAAAAAVA
jgi:PAS domain S-box-containing protein